MCLQILLEWSWTAASRNVVGRQFHANGPATEKQHFCAVAPWHLGIVRRSWSAEWRCRRPGTDDTRMHCSRTRPAMQFATMSSNLNCILRCAGSQCSWPVMTAEMWENFGSLSSNRAAAFMIRWILWIFEAEAPVRTMLQQSILVTTKAGPPRGGGAGGANAQGPGDF